MVSIDEGSSGNGLDLYRALLISYQLDGGGWDNSRVSKRSVDLVLLLGEFKLAGGSGNSSINWLVRANLKGALGYSGEDGSSYENSTTTARYGDLRNLIFGSSSGSLGEFAGEISTSSNDLSKDNFLSGLYQKLHIL